MIVAVERGDEVDQVRGLLAEYWQSFGFTPCFQGFSEELAALPAAYAPPGGVLLLATVEGQAAGCAAFRQHRPTQCEAKRLYVRPGFRGHGLGRLLLSRLIEEATRMGYQEMLGDTMPVMEQALAMYERIGFQRIPPYLDEPTAEAICIRLRLQPR